MISVSNIDIMLVCPAPSEVEGIPHEVEAIPKECCITINEGTGADSITPEDMYDIDILKPKIIKKIAPMLDPNYYELPFDWIWKLPKVSNSNKIDINDVIQVTPHRGILKPGMTQLVHVIFRPKTNISVKATLECEVLGGPSETIVVTGQSSDLMYKINTQNLNFKIRSFHENASERIVISNVAPLPFEYITYLDEPKFENELQATILDLVPPEKVLEHKENAELQIIVRPGVVGYFKRNFLLEIGHLPYIPIEVFGWGVIPQVFLTLPRPEMINVSI